MYGLCRVFIDWMKDGYISVSDLFGGINEPETFRVQLGINRNAAEVKAFINHTSGEGNQPVPGFHWYNLYFIHIHRYFFRQWILFYTLCIIQNVILKKVTRIADKTPVSFTKCTLY